MVKYAVGDQVWINNALADPDNFGSVGGIRGMCGAVRRVGPLHAMLPTGDIETVYDVQITWPRGTSELFSLVEHYLDPAG